MSFVGIVILFLVVLFLVAFGMVVYGTLYGKSRRLKAKAEQKLREGNRDEAVSLLSRVASLNPFNVDVRWKLGQLFGSMGQYEQAVEHLGHCVRNESLPDDVTLEEALVQLADLHEQEGVYDRAIQVWDRYLERNPDSKEAVFRRGQARFEAGHHTDAASDFEYLLQEFDPPPRFTRLYLARCYNHLGQLDEALDYYEEHFERSDDQGSWDVLLEAADVAEGLDQLERARTYYEDARREGTQAVYNRATVQLLELSLREGQESRILEHLNELEQLVEEGELPRDLQLRYWYLKAQYYEASGQTMEAEDLYWSIYHQDPDFADVADIIDDILDSMDQQSLLDRYMRVDRGEFVKMAERVTELMGYDVLTSDSFGPDEVNVAARKDSPLMKVDRVLFTFKRWDNPVGEWPLKEFELQLVEKRFDQGFFVCPSGFSKTARAFAEGQSMKLIGPDKLLTHLREAQKEKT